MSLPIPPLPLLDIMMIPAILQQWLRTLRAFFAASDTYVPVASGAVNLVTTPVMTVMKSSQVGNLVTISGGFSATATAAGATSTGFDFTLPNITSFAARSDLSGTSVAGFGPDAAEVFALVGSAGRVRWQSNDTILHNWSYIAQYKV